MTAPFTLPAPVPVAAGWQLTDYKPDLTLRTEPAAGGLATATADPVEPGYMWSIQRAVCSSTSGAPTQLRLYDSAVDPVRLLTGSNSGNFDEADYPLGLLLGGGRQLVAQWTGADDGSIGALRLQIAVLHFVGS